MQLLTEAQLIDELNVWEQEPCYK